MSIRIHSDRLDFTWLMCFVVSVSQDHISVDVQCSLDTAFSGDSHNISEVTMEFNDFLDRVDEHSKAIETQAAASTESKSTASDGSETQAASSTKSKSTASGSTGSDQEEASRSVRMYLCQCPIQSTDPDVLEVLPHLKSDVATPELIGGTRVQRVRLCFDVKDVSPDRQFQWIQVFVRLRTVYMSACQHPVHFTYPDVNAYFVFKAMFRYQNSLTKQYYKSCVVVKRFLLMRLLCDFVSKSSPMN